MIFLAPLFALLRPYAVHLILLATLLGVIAGTAWLIYEKGRQSVQVDNARQLEQTAERFGKAMQDAKKTLETEDIDEAMRRKGWIR